ncbi:MAG: glycosyltransferase [Rhodothermaceae bacterium]|nr:glycosyltransferase [Rhodothermaceae bacterium]
MTYLLIASNLILLAISFNLIRNRFLFKPLSSVPNTRLRGLPAHSYPSISVCIPARNEENNIGRCVESLLNQKYASFQILVLDDNSEDGTGIVLDALQKDHPEKLNVYRGRPKPDGWLGKQWACQQLSEYATGDLLIFADADTWFETDVLMKTASAFTNYGADMITVWPRQHLESFWERLLIPLVYYALIGFLPTHYTFRKPLWMPAIFYGKFAHLFAAACGQFLAFRSYAYHLIGGHESVKADVVEDVELAKLFRKNKLQVLMLHGMGSVNCRMYTNHREIREGFRKNFLAGFGYNLPIFIISAIGHIIVFVLPFVVPFITTDPTTLLMSVSAVTLILLHRLLLASWFRWNKAYAFIHPLAVLWFQYLGIVVLADYLLKRKITWKNRPI